MQATISIGPNCKRLEQEVRERYGDQELADKVVLILKMALGLFAYGHPGCAGLHPLPNVWTERVRERRHVR